MGRLQRAGPATAPRPSWAGVVATAMIAGWLFCGGGGLAGVAAEQADPTYTEGQTVQVWATHVGPVANPSETYPFNTLPYCRMAGAAGGEVVGGEGGNGGEREGSLGESFSGDRKMAMPYAFKFMEDQESVEVCTMELSEDDIDRFSTAIEEEWFGELYVDDLPMWVYVGESESEDFLLGHTEQSRHWLYTHWHFTIGYNGDRIVSANVTAMPTLRTDITTHDPTHEELPDLGTTKRGRLGLRHGHGGHGHGAGEDEGVGGGPISVTFTYSVSFVEEPGIEYENRMEVYERNSFMPAALEIHWLSIINSLVLVMLLTAFLAIILMRVVRNDFTRYMREEEDDNTVEDETGWKSLHGDVFRVPSNPSLFAAFVGTGWHLFTMTLLLLTLALAGTFSLARRGSMVAACIILYVLTAFIGGAMSARTYRHLKGSNWVWNIMLALVVVPAPLTATFTVLNTAALAKSSTAALPPTTIMVVVALFVFIAFPLTVLGGVAGHNSREFEPPCRVSKAPRQIPDVPWYRSLPAQLFMAGFLPFSAISIELHYIFASVWGHKVYTLYGLLFIAFVLLTVVTSFITVALTYFQLAAEDHRWWWRSFLSGGSVGFFIFAYCFFYYFNHSGMSGFLQTAFYFLYMANVSFAFFLMNGAIGYTSAFLFVKYIYSSIKSD